MYSKLLLISQLDSKIGPLLGQLISVPKELVQCNKDQFTDPECGLVSETPQ